MAAEKEQSRRVFCPGSIDNHYIKKCNGQELMKEALDTLALTQTVDNPREVEKWAETLWNYGAGRAATEKKIQI